MDRLSIAYLEAALEGDQSALIGYTPRMIIQQLLDTMREVERLRKELQDIMVSDDLMEAQFHAELGLNPNKESEPNCYTIADWMKDTGMDKAILEEYNKAQSTQNTEEK